MVQHHFSPCHILLPILSFFKLNLNFLHDPLPFFLYKTLNPMGIPRILTIFPSWMTLYSSSVTTNFAGVECWFLYLFCYDWSLSLRPYNKFTEISRRFLYYFPHFQLKHWCHQQSFLCKPDCHCLVEFLSFTTTHIVHIDCNTHAYRINNF